MRTSESICIRSRTSEKTRGYRYRVASREVVSDVPLPCMASFAIAGSGKSWPMPAFDDNELVKVEWQSSGRFVVANGSHRVYCRASTRDLQVDIDGIGRLILRDHGRAIVCKPATAPQHHDPIDVLLESAIVGPGILLSLAYAGIFALHGSAVGTPDGRSVALIGESGAGKSTLAEASGDDWPRVADDVVPVAFHGGTAVLLPHYPQLKMSNDEQYPRGAPERVELCRIYLLAPGEPDEAADVVMKPVARRDATLALVRHTVASRIFPPPLLAAHLAFCIRLAAAVPVHELRYRRERQTIPSILQSIRHG